MRTKPPTDYKKTNYETVTKINQEAASIAASLDLADRIELMSVSVSVYVRQKTLEGM